METWRRKDKVLTGDRQLIRDLNIALVTDVIRRHGPISRVGIARETKLGKSTVTGIIGQLLTEGLVREVGSAESSGGRRAVLLQLNAEARQVLAVKVGPDSVTAALADLNASIGARAVEPLRRKPDEIISIIEAAVRRVVAEAGADWDRILGLGVVLPGVVDPETGTSVSSHFLDWANMPLRQLLEERLGIHVFLDNDANAMTLAEQWFGSGRGFRNLLGVTLGIGIGAGVIIDGRLYRGAKAGAGEVGHITIDENGPACKCGNRGCLEALAADGAIVRAAREELERLRVTDQTPEEAPEEAPVDGQLLPELCGGNLDVITREMVVNAAKAGDELCRGIIAEAGRHIGTGLATVVNIINPEAIIIGGEAAIQAGPLLLGPMAEALRARAFSNLADGLAILPAALGNDGWLIGAAAEVLEEVFKLPVSQNRLTRSAIAVTSLLRSQEA